MMLVGLVIAGIIVTVLVGHPLLNKRAGAFTEKAFAYFLLLLLVNLLILMGWTYGPIVLAAIVVWFRGG